MRKWTLIFVRFLIRNFQTFGYVSYFWIWFFCVYNILPLRFCPIFFLILRYNCRKIFIPWTTLFRAISSLFSLRKICTLCKKFVTISKKINFDYNFLSLNFYPIIRYLLGAFTTLCTHLRLGLNGLVRKCTTDC